MTSETCFKTPLIKLKEKEEIKREERKKNKVGKKQEEKKLSHRMDREIKIRSTKKSMTEHNEGASASTKPTPLF